MTARGPALREALLRWALTSAALALSCAPGPVRAQSPADAVSDVDAADAGADAATDERGASGEAEGETPSAPTEITIGVYPLQVTDVDLEHGTAVMTYYVWTRWEGAADGRAYEVVNGAVDAREHEFLSDEGDLHYAYYRCRATVQLDLDFHDFPLDHHAITLDIEHSDEGDESVVFVVDREGVARIPSPSITDWEVDAPRYEISRASYPTNWGFPGSEPDETTYFSHLRMSIGLHHALGATFAKTFLTLFISVLITFLAFFMHPEDLEARVGVGVAGIFGAVTSQAVVSGNLPDIPYLTLSDEIHILGLAFIFLALLESVAAGWLSRRDRTATALEVDRLARLVIGPGFAIAVLAVLLLR